MDMEKIIDEAKWVILMYDQLNTNHLVERHGSRGKLLHGAVSDLRNAMVEQGIDPTTTKSQGVWMEGWANPLRPVDTGG